MNGKNLSWDELKVLYDVDSVNRSIMHKFGQDLPPKKEYTTAYINNILNTPSAKEFNEKFGYDPNIAIRKRYDQLGEQLVDAWSKSKHAKSGRGLLERLGVEVPEKLDRPLDYITRILMAKTPGAIEERAFWQEELGDVTRTGDLDPEVEKIIEERSRIRQVMTQAPVVLPSLSLSDVVSDEKQIAKPTSWDKNVSSALWDIGIGGRTIDPEKKKIKTQGFVSGAISGLSDTAWLGGSMGKAHAMSDEEAAAYLNYLGQTDPFFKTIVNSSLYESGKKNALETVTHVGAYILGISPEFMIAGHFLKGAQGLKIIQNLSKFKGWQPIVKQLARADKTGKTLRTFFSLAAQSTETAMQFGIHTLLTGRPEQVPANMMSGAWMGLGGRIFEPRFVKGKPVSLIRAMVGAGTGDMLFTGIMTKVRGIPYTLNDALADFVTAFGMYGTRYKSLGNVQKMNDNIKANTGINIIDELGPKEGSKWLKDLAKASEDQIIQMKFQELLNLEEYTHHKPAEKVDHNEIERNKYISDGAKQTVVEAGTDLPEPTKEVSVGLDLDKLEEPVTDPTMEEFRKINAELRQAKEEASRIHAEAQKEIDRIEKEEEKIKGIDEFSNTERRIKKQEKLAALNEYENAKKRILELEKKLDEIVTKDQVSTDKVINEAINDPKPFTPQEAVKDITVNFGNIEEGLRSNVNKLNVFVDTVQRNKNLDMEQRNRLFKDIEHLAYTADSSTDFVQKAMQLIPDYDPLFRMQPETGEASLRRMYHEFRDRSLYGSPGQFSLAKVVIGNDGTVQVLDAVRSKTENINDLVDYRSLGSEKMGPNVAVFEGVTVKGQYLKISEMDIKTLNSTVAQLYKKGYFYLPFRSDSGKGLISKKHARFNDPDALAKAERDLASFLNRIENDYQKDHTLNMHFYLQDVLGMEYMKHMQASGQLTNIQDLTKRFQIIMAKGTIFDLKPYDAPENLDIVNGQARIKAVIVPDNDVVFNDPSRITDTDGWVAVSGPLFDALLKNYGVDNIPETSYAKSFTYLDPDFNQKQGALLGKHKLVRATADIEKQMAELGVQIIFHDSTVKYRGNRKLNEVFEMVPEAIRTNFVEHFDHKTADGKLKHSYINLYRQTLYYGNDDLIKSFKNRALKKLNKELEFASKSPENFALWFKEKVMRKQDWNGERAEAEQVDFTEIHSTAEKMFESMDWSKVGVTHPIARDYAVQAIYNYLSNSVLSPSIRGHNFSMTGMPEWTKAGNPKLEGMLGRQIAAENEIIIGDIGRELLIDDLLKNDGIDIYRGDKKLDNKQLLAKGYRTLGDIFSKETGDIGVKVADVRGPVEDIGGIRAHRIVGIAPKGTGTSVYMSPREFNFLGGADSDGDKVALYLEKGAEWERMLVDKYGNSDYLKQTKIDFEQKRLPQQQKQLQEGAQVPKGQLNPDLYNPHALLDTGKKMLNAKESIGLLMSLDRVLRTLGERAHSLVIKGIEFKPKVGREYDALMLYYKRTAVDAKHGGFGEWDKVRREIINTVYGTSQATDLLANDPLYKDASMLFRTVFGRNYEQNRAWTSEERRRVSREYFKKYKPVTQLEEFIRDIPEFDISNIGDISYKNLKEAMSAASLSTGGLRYLELLEKYNINNRNDIDNVELTPQFKKDIAAKWFENLDIPEKSQYDVKKRNRAIKRVTDWLRSETEIPYSQLKGESKDQFVSRLKQAVNMYVKDSSYRDWLGQMFTRADDFIANDIHSIVSQTLYNQLNKSTNIPADLKTEANKVINRLNILTNDMYKYENRNQRDLYKKRINQTLFTLNDMIRKEGTREFADWVGVNFLGSVFDPQYGRMDSMDRMRWSKWLDEGFAMRYGAAVKELYTSLLTKEARAKEVPDHKQLETLGIAEPVIDYNTGAKQWQYAGSVDIDLNELTRGFQKEIETQKGEQPTELSESEVQRLNRLEIEAATKFLTTLADPKDKASPRAIAIAKKELAKVFLNPLSPWTTGKEFVLTFLDRPTAEHYNFDKYPLTSKEIMELVIKAKDIQRDLKLAAGGNSNALSKFFWEVSTPKVIMEKSPETWHLWNSWFSDTNKSEAKLSQLRNETNAVIRDIYPVFRDLKRSGKIIQTLIEKGMDTKIDGITDFEAEKHRIAAKKVKRIYDEVWPFLEAGYKAYVDNVVDKLPENMRDAVRNKLLKKFAKREGYFTHFVKMANEIVEEKARTLVDNYKSNLISLEELYKELGTTGITGHAKGRKESAKNLEIETDLEKVLFTYLENTMPWALRQKIERSGKRAMVGLRAKIDYMKNIGKDVRFIETLANYTDILSDAVLGRYQPIRDPKLLFADKINYDLKTGTVQNIEINGEKTDNSGFVVEYKDPFNNIQYKPLNTQDVKQAEQMYGRMKLNLGYRIAENVTNSILSSMFAKNIGFNISSAARNHTQKMFPFWMSAFDGFGSYIDWKYRGGITFEIEGEDGKITRRDYNSVLAEAKRLAGLEYSQMQGMTGEIVEMQRLTEQVYGELAKELNSTIMSNTYEVTHKIADLLNKFAEISGSAEITRHGKKIGLPFRDLVAFSKVEVGGMGNRNFAFEMGFHPVFKEMYYKYKLAGLNDRDSMNLAIWKAIKAGEHMVEFTQYDYHTYNAPAILRGTGASGLSNRILLQFKKYTINYYTMLRKIFTDSITASYVSEGRKKVLNKYAGRLASFMVTHALVAGVSTAFGLALDNFIQEDTGAWLIDTFRWLTGSEDQSYWARTQTPIPFGLGPFYGMLASAALIGMDVQDREVEEFLMQELLPRGPRKQYDIAKNLVENVKTGNGYRTLAELARLVGISLKWRK